MGPSLTGKPGWGGCGGLQCKNVMRKEGDMCLLLPRRRREKQVVIFDSRRTCFQCDPGGHTFGKGDPSHRQAVCVLLYCWEEGRQKRKNAFSFPTEELQFGNWELLSGRSLKEDTSVRAHRVASVRKTQPSRI